MLFNKNVLEAVINDIIDSMRKPYGKYPVGRPYEVSNWFLSNRLLVGMNYRPEDFSALMDDVEQLMPEYAFSRIGDSDGDSYIVRKK